MRRYVNQLRLWWYEQRRQYLKTRLAQQETPETQGPWEQSLQRVHEKIDKIAGTFPLKTLSQLSQRIPIKRQGKARKLALPPSYRTAGSMTRKRS